MDRISASLLTEFSTQQSIDSLPEDQRFEHFAAFISIWRQHSKTFATTDIVIGSGSDTGIDAIAILVNGNLVTDIDDFEETNKVTDLLEVAFIFVQAERSSAFDTAKIGTFSFGVLDFFKDKPSLARSQAVTDAAAIMSAIYAQSSKFKRGNPECLLYYVTTGVWVGDGNLEARRSASIADLTAMQLFGKVEFTPVGAPEIQKLYSQTKNALAREFIFEKRTEIPEIEGVTEAYLGFIPASQFMKIISDDNGAIVHSIFYDNIRDWQDYNAVNSGMRGTLQSPERARFVLMNNGVTIIARTLHKTASRFHIEDFQIVNGCQTSHTLFFERDKLKDDASVMVPLRLIVTQDEAIITAIIQATNSQTEVKQDQFFAATDFAKSLEIFFQAYPDHQKLYYERRSRQYSALLIEKTRIVTPQSVVRAFASMFLEEPHRGTRDYKALSEKVGKEIFVDGHKLDPYYTAAYASYKLEFLFRNQKVEPKYKGARFHLLLAVRLLVSLKPVPKMNSYDMEKFCKAILAELWDGTKAENLFAKAVAAVAAVAADNLHRDHVRTHSFTEKLIALLKAEANADSAVASSSMAL